MNSQDPGQPTWQIFHGDHTCRRDGGQAAHQNLMQGVWKVKALSEFMKRSTSEYILKIKSK